MYNQYAWLVGNTEGDFDEALRVLAEIVGVAARGRRLLRHAGPRLFRQGRLENAVKYQTKAAQLDPHSGLIHKKLDVFRKKLEEEKKKKKGKSRTRQSTTVRETVVEG